MNDNLDFDFRDQVEHCDWSLLATHQKLENLYLVERGLSLPSVGEAFKNDSLEKVKNWLQNNEIRKPTEEEVNLWANENKNRQKFQFLIVQPFVLAQTLLEN